MISLRRDPEIDSILARLGDAYGNTTDTLKTALRHLLAERAQADLAEEAARLAADPIDRAEIAAINAQMEQISAW